MKVHSVVDLVTNSSSELFIARNHETTVEDAACKIQAVWNALSEAVDYGRHSTNIDEMLSIYLVTSKNVQVVNQYTSWYRDYSNVGPIEVGNIIIEGNSDNSIPWVLMDVIEDMFNGCVRIHLG